MPDAEYELRSRPVAEIGKVGAHELRIGGQALRQIETEWQLSLKPWFDSVPVRRKHLRLIRREHGDMEIQGLAELR